MSNEPIVRRPLEIESAEPLLGEFRPDETRPRRLAQALHGVRPVLWLVAIGAVYLAPALAHGLQLGPYDILGELGLTAQPHALVHNPVGSDELAEFIPWQIQSWLQVHAGHLPLWNPLSVLGLPLAFNFQSAPFSLAVAVGYLVPLGLAHTTTVVVRLLIAGTGAYVLGRVLGLRTLSAIVCATIYELSGGLTIWLGAYEAGCLGFMGWVMAASVLVLRGRNRARDVAFLALALALMLYAGEPQIALLALGFLAIFVFVMVLPLARAGLGLARRPLLDHLFAVAGGIALAAPVYFPGVQLALKSARATGPPVAGLPLYDLTHLIFGDYNGSPTALGQLIGPDNLYVSMIYVGVIGVVLAVVALALAHERREVVAFSVLTGCLLVLLFVRPVVDLMSHITYLRVFRIFLATTLLDFALAVLAGFGCEALLRRRPSRGISRPDRLLACSLVAVTAGLLVLVVRLAINVDHLTPAARSARAASFIWPAVGVGALAILVLVRRRSRGRHRAWHPQLGLGALLVVETAFLAVTGAGIWSSSSNAFAATPTIAALGNDVGTSLVAMGSCERGGEPQLGLAPDANLPYGIAELTALDPILPSAYYLAYGRVTHTATTPAKTPALYCPAITSVGLARRFGVSYILEPAGVAGPPGTTRAAVLGGEGLYSVPDSSRATLVAIGNGSKTAVTASVVEPSPTSYRVTIDPRVASDLRLRITDVPGWIATLDGRPLPLRRWDAVMLEATVPPGAGVVELVYRPRAFSIGLRVALLGALALIGAVVVERVRRRRRSRRADGDDLGGALPRLPAPTAIAVVTRR